MMQIKSIDNCDFIISIAEIYLIKSNGDKTVFFLRGFEKPIYTEHNINEMIAFLTQRGILKGSAPIANTQENLPGNHLKYINL
ncbi:hypothetical protein [Serratia sp. M24T3]|uniref:hypothetical protein n=1 Tax=Serratia sp. M24T3 TaxID=932213 RepID=UPI00025B9919|nr:hypothetical protein [Serratia sp. M24T3]EIC83815.1 hypothetical protein SPM24T3_14696 [Serratia sp. M24T3]